MTPTFRVMADKLDVTDKLKDRLIELRVTDEIGNISDRLEIELDDRGQAVQVPSYGSLLHVSLGYQGDKLRPLTELGGYRYDESAYRFPPATVTIRARAADPSDRDKLPGFKEPRSRSWADHTIGKIVEEIAAFHGWTAAVCDEFVDLLIPDIHQTEESDLNFLGRLAKENGAVCKPASNRLLFVHPGEAKTFTGREMPTVTLKPGDISQCEFTQAARGKYKSVVARWKDWNARTTHHVRYPKHGGEPHYLLRYPYPTLEEATRAAKSHFESLSRGYGRLSIEMPGDPRVRAETKLLLSGFPRSLDNEWVVHRVTHSLNNGGYHCTIEAELTAPDVNSTDVP